MVGHGAGISSLAMSPCGRQLASGSVDGTICIWDIAEGRRMHLLKGHRGPVWALDYSNGLECSPILASGGADCTLRFWGSADEAASGGGLLKDGGQEAAAGDQQAGRSGSNIALLKTFTTKSIPVHSLRFSATNLLTATGALTLRQRANYG
uniref:Anaphase-promoting complex subunit 4 WD40 domain-containing protein n=1 Tax=Tetraselmis chuii TaxID=63592 RepID=A0A7S1T3D1_9CHLO